MITRAPLDIQADLTLDVEGTSVHIDGRGDTVIVDLPNLRTGRKLLAAEPLAGRRRSLLEQADRALRDVGMTLDIRLRGAPFSRLGMKARPGAIARLVRLRQVELRPGTPVRSYVRRHPVVALAVAAGAIGLAAWLIGGRR